MIRRFRTWAHVVLAAAVALLMTSCALLSQPSQVDGSYTDITVDQLATMLEDKDFTLVNVHVPYEGEIAQTDLFIPFDDIAQHTDELPEKDDPIVLYCRSGSMSTTAAETLVSLGYSQVFEVDGGMNAWRAAGYELLGQ
ncbi:MAG: rhodanese-like domain-containing protein [Anaerolineae bacterium]|jgi:rhodanese-related sulfurtransferase